MSKALLNKYKNVTSLKEMFSDGCVKLECEDRLIKMETLTNYVVIDEPMIIENAKGKVVNRDVIAEIPLN